jgi:apolipoprotein D and lipocalin family protein
MQFLWPIKAEYRILFVDPEYQRTVIGRSKRDYVWLMTRSPRVTEREYAELLDVVTEAGYDLQRLQPVPQQWPETTSEPITR